MIHVHTIRSLMELTSLKYDQTYSLIRRMRDKNLVQDLGLTKSGSTNAKKYGLLVSPEQFLKEEREPVVSPPPPEGFFNNPFNLRETDNLKLEQWKND